MPRARVTKKDQALIRKIKIELRNKRAAERLPDGPHLENGQPTPAGLTLIRMLATRGSTQGKIASILFLGAKQFKKMLADDSETPTPARLAYEAGVAEHKSALIEQLTARAAAGDSNAAMYLLRAMHDLRDSGPSINIDNSEKRITLTMPGSYSQADYMKSIGQTEVLQSTPGKSALVYESKPNPADMLPTLGARTLPDENDDSAWGGPSNFKASQ